MKAWLIAHLKSLSPRFKALAITVILAAGSLSIPKAQAWIVSNLGQHPKLTAWASTLLTIIALYQKPYVQGAVNQVLNIKQTAPDKAEISVEQPTDNAAK